MAYERHIMFTFMNKVQPGKGLLCNIRKCSAAFSYLYLVFVSVLVRDFINEQE